MSKFLQSKGFQHRLKGSLFLTLVTLPSYFLAGGLPFRIVVTLGLIIAVIELRNVALKSAFFLGPNNLAVFAVLYFFALGVSIVAVWYFPVEVTGGVAVVAVTTDVFAYFGGKLFGNKTTSFKPFPHISPNKTWEGTYTGVFLGIVAAVLWTNYVLPTATDSLKMCFLWIPLFAVAGDLLESYFKRRAGVKDANDFLLDKPVIGQIEGLLGGQGGHGGYLDRLDSFSFVLFLLVLVDIFCNLCY